MNYQITSDNISLSPSMKALALEKLEKLDRVLKDIDENSRSARVVLNKGAGDEDTFVCKIHLNVKGKEYFSDDTDYTLETAIVRTIEELVRMIKKEKKY